MPGLTLAVRRHQGKCADIREEETRPCGSAKEPVSAAADDYSPEEMPVSPPAPWTILRLNRFLAQRAGRSRLHAGLAVGQGGATGGAMKRVGA